jgi:hypothetical protein
MGCAIFPLSLKEFVETGKGRPHPYDMPVNLWSPSKEAAARGRATAPTALGCLVSECGHGHSKAALALRLVWQDNA